jgi:BirA family transcriptional regulator, biotin operon repressor / biotin---[acetyl-CoA-carboxylase] ligase
VSRPLDAAALRRALVVDHGLWTALDVVEQTGSTNADLVAAARAGAPEGRVLVAEHQYAGRGRAGRRWSTPPYAALAVSVLLRPGAGSGDGPAAAAGAAAGAGHRPSVPAGRWGWLPLLGGVALVDAVGEVTGLGARLKWPNDVLVDGGKCAGILAESTGEAVVLGIGVNVTQGAGDLPSPEPDAVPATSLALAGADRPDREALLRALLRRLADWYNRWCAAAGDADGCGLRAAYLAGSATVGATVRMLLPGGGELTGEAVTVGPDGRLVLRTPDGEPRTVSSGEVVHLRPA